MKWKRVEMRLDPRTTYSKSSNVPAIPLFLKKVQEDWHNMNCVNVCGLHLYKAVSHI
jgi:hypothetical protein